MAGNTKLIGFGVGSKVTLARWGKEHVVEISSDSWKALQSACSNDLPRKPPSQEKGKWKDDLNAQYDEHVGRVRVDLSVEAAGELVDHLSFFRDTEVADKLEPWVRHLKEAIQDHTAFHNTDEPGVP